MIKRFTKKPIETFKRDNFSLEISKRGRDVLISEKMLSSLKYCQFTPLSLASNLFNIKNKRVFIKESTNPVDALQLNDYLKQRKIVSNIPEMYGTLKLKNGKVYIFSKYINNSILLSDYLKTAKKEEILSIRKQIQIIGKKLIKECLLPWDFKIRQFFYSPKTKKIYFCDNSVAFHNPKVLISYFKKANLKIPTTLKKLYLLYSLNPMEIISVSLKKLKKGLNKETLYSSNKLKEKIKTLKSKGKSLVLRDLNKLILKTIAFYDSLPIEIKKKIQEEILKDALSFLDDNFLNNSKES